MDRAAPLNRHTQKRCIHDLSAEVLISGLLAAKLLTCEFGFATDLIVYAVIVDLCNIITFLTIFLCVLVQFVLCCTIGNNITCFQLIV